MRIKFENRTFEELFKDIIFFKLNLKIIKVWEVKVLKIKLENESFEKLNWKEIEVLKINWKLKIWKLVLKEIGVLKIKNLEKLHFDIKIWRIKDDEMW